MIQRYVVLALLFFGTSTQAECFLNLTYGQGSVSNIPTSHVQDALTTKYTHVTSRIEGSSNISEIGVECELGHEYYLAVSHMDGLRASVDHELFFDGYALGTVGIPGIDLSGYSFPGIKHSRFNIPAITFPNVDPSRVDLSHVRVPGFKLLDIHERATAEAWRVSLVKYFDMGKVDPYVRIGAEQARAIHSGTIPVAHDIRIAYQKTYEVIAPYAGLGVTYNRGRSVSFRAGVDFLSLSPHNIWTWSVGVDIPLRFKN